MCFEGLVLRLSQVSGKIIKSVYIESPPHRIATSETPKVIHTIATHFTTKVLLGNVVLFTQILMCQQMISTNFIIMLTNRLLNRMGISTTKVIKRMKAMGE